MVKGMPRTMLRPECKLMQSCWVEGTLGQSPGCFTAVVVVEHRINQLITIDNNRDMVADGTTLIL